jgi:hypothetical protein
MPHMSNPLPKLADVAGAFSLISSILLNSFVHGFK